MSSVSLVWLVNTLGVLPTQCEKDVQLTLVPNIQYPNSLHSTSIDKIVVPAGSGEAAGSIKSKVPEVGMSPMLSPMQPLVRRPKSIGSFAWALGHVQYSTGRNG